MRVVGGQREAMPVMPVREASPVEVGKAQASTSDDRVWSAYLIGLSAYRTFHYKELDKFPFFTLELRGPFQEPALFLLPRKWYIYINHAWPRFRHHNVLTAHIACSMQQIPESTWQRCHPIVQRQISYSACQPHDKLSTSIAYPSAQLYRALEENMQPIPAGNHALHK